MSEPQNKFFVPIKKIKKEPRPKQEEEKKTEGGSMADKRKRIEDLFKK